MKTTRKLLAMVLAAVMILSLCVTAFATNSDGESYDNGSITIRNPQENETYKAYKIFDVTYDLGNDGTNDDKYAYTIAPEWVDDVQAYVGNTKGSDDTYPAITAKGLTITPVKDTSGVVVYNVARVPDDPATTDVNEDIFSAADFGEAMAGKTSGKTPIALDEKTTDGKPTQDGLDLGYYMVQPTTANSLVSLTTTDADVTVSDKNEKPPVDKKLVGEEDILICKKQSTDPNGENYDASHVHSKEAGCYAEKDYTTKSVGDNVPFELDCKVPDMTGYDVYFYVANDTLSKGLTFNNDVEVTLGGSTLPATAYTVKVVENDDGTTNVRIVFNDMVGKWTEGTYKTDDPIVITYSATVDEDAVMGTTGNPNKAFIEFSNNPNVIPEFDPTTGGDPNDPKDPNYNFNDPDYDGKKPVGEGPEDKVTVYSAELDLTKVDAANPNVTLTGAKFKIEGESLNVSLINKEIFEVDNTNGTWYRLKDGTYTQDAPDGDADTPAKDPVYTEKNDVTPVTYTELTGDDKVPGVGLYYSVDGGTTKTRITDSNLATVQALTSYTLYQPTYNAVGLYYKDSSDQYVQITEANAAEHINESAYYSATIYKQSDLYEDTKTKYRKVEVVDKNTTNTNISAEGFVDKNGLVTFGGLGEGTYYITELVAPDGYNLLKEPITVVIELVDGDTAGSHVFQATIGDATSATAEAGGHISFNVANSQGIELPETGGIGTTIFYVLGAALVLGGIIVFVTKKRMEA